MALITKDNMKKLDKDRNSVHSKVRATPHNLHLQTKPPSKMLSG